jgi:hypothetical protein
MQPMFSTRIRTAIATVVAIAVGLGLAAQAQAAVDYYTIQAKPPGGSRDHRLRYVGVDNPSTEERVKLSAGSKIHAGHLWRLVGVQQATVDPSGKPVTSHQAYRFVNALTGQCLSYKLPWQDGAGVFQQVSGCRGWVLDAGKGPVKITDRTGRANGFALRMIDKCIDLPGGEIAAGTPLQLSGCTGATNQKFLIKIRLRDHRAGAITGGG